MTVSLGGYDFDPMPEVVLGSEAEYAKQPTFLGGTGLEFTGYMPILITLDGELTGVDCYTDRDTLIDLLTGGVELEFYADTINYGSAGSPKLVTIKSYNFVHEKGVGQDNVPFQIVLEVAT